MKSIIRILLLLGLVARLGAADRPNIIIVFTDDQGFEDVGCFGSPKIKTPCLDHLATEGLRFDHFYVGASVCSASRASLLTGRYSIHHGTRGVYAPGHDGLNLTETTLANILHDAGYATASFGKWHLGNDEKFLPTRRGFDAYFGIPYSNDMYIGADQKFAENCVFLAGWDRARALADQAFVKAHLKDRASIHQRGLKGVAPLMSGDEIVEYPANQATLTRRYFDHAIDFIDQSGEKPFFLYITPAMPHVPLAASEPFLGKSARGLYGDAVEEIDWNIGRLLDHLDAKKLSANTLVIFTSDNGPWLSEGKDSGSAGPFRDGKFTSYEGGFRLPAIMRWPGHFPAGRLSHEMLSTLDYLPTLAHYAGAALPKMPLDGINVSAFLENPDLPSGRDTFFYMNNGQVAGVRVGPWKYLEHGGNKDAKPSDAPELYNLADDIAEKTNLATAHPEKVRELQAKITAFLVHDKTPE